MVYFLAFVAVMVVIAVVSIVYDARAYRARIVLQKQKQKEVAQYYPIVRSKEEADRAYELERAKLDLQQQKLDLDRDKFRFESFLALSRIDVGQHGTYLINQEQASLTLLAPIHKPDGKLLAAPNQAQDIQVQRPTQEQLLAALENNHESFTFSPGINKTDGSVVIVSLTKVPHLKLVGSTGFGKSCLAGAVIDQTTETNSPQKLQLALLDLEHKTSRLYEDLPHVASVHVGKRLVQLVATDADEVAEHVEYLKKELDRRALLSQQELRKTPVLLMYVEEMLALSYEPFDAKTLARLFANLTILAVRGRKYGMFLLAAMQIDYSTDELKVASKMFRFRGAAAVDVTAARASGFINTDLIKQNFQTARKGEFVVEFPSFSNIVIAPDYDVEYLLNKKDGVFDEEENEVFEPCSDDVQKPDLRIVNSERTTSEHQLNRISEHAEHLPQAKVEEVQALRKQEWGKIAIIEKVWGAQRGDNKAYRLAEAEYNAIIAESEENR